ncbi:MAG: geranylgeranylglycerol-phosphate geranylgeranyltransferase, partial [Halobacteria archaeon]|nr:geranylgeranylglycerol-phosphate geranylgeranyltransferase [Halobacteria archaeon]
GDAGTGAGKGTGTDADNDVPKLSVAKLKALIEVTRPANSLFGGVAALIGVFIAGFQPVEAHIVPATVAFSATALGTAAGNTINDYYDAEIDAVNNPKRPIPSGRLTRKEAFRLSTAMFFTAVVIVIAFLPTLAIAIGIVNLVALVGYSLHLKRMPFAGNATVGYLTGSAFLFGGAAVGGIEFTVVLFLLASFATIGREIVKDIEDIEGDRKAGARTLPIVWGKRRSLVIASDFVIFAVILSPIPYAIDVFGLPYLVAIAPADLILLASVYLSWNSPEKGHRLMKLG